MSVMLQPIRRVALCASAIAASAASGPIAHAQTVTWPASYAAHMAHEHAGETPVANASSTVAPGVNVTGEDVTYGTAADGSALHGYLAHPTKPGRHPLPGVVAIHEWWGLNDNVRATARRWAGEGYSVLAVDLYGGKSATVPDSAQRLMLAVMANPDQALANLTAANAYLRGTQHAPKVGTVGWCFGGGWSIRNALFNASQIDAAVAYYGPPDLDRSHLAMLRAPFLGLYGGADQGIPVAQVTELHAVLDSLGKTSEFRIYDGAKHAFANPSGPAYNAAAADDAWGRATAFFARYLKG